METVDGGDVGEDEFHHILREGLATACLPQQLLEKHLHREPAATHTLLRRKPTPAALDSGHLTDGQTSQESLGLGQGNSPICVFLGFGPSLVDGHLVRAISGEANAYMRLARTKHSA